MSELKHLEQGQPCCIVVSWDRQCGQLAHWQVVDPDGNMADTPICDGHIQGMAGMNSDNEQFLRPALDEIAWRNERRSLFIAAMRQPEMCWLREAFKHLRDDQGIDWREIKEIRTIWPRPGLDDANNWTMETDRFVTFLLFPDRYDGIEDFMTIMNHEEGNPYCKCYWCYDGTIEKLKAEWVSA